MPGGEVHGDRDHLLQLGAGAGQPLGHQPRHQAADIVDVIDIVDDICRYYRYRYLLAPGPQPRPGGRSRTSHGVHPPPRLLPITANLCNTFSSLASVCYLFPCFSQVSVRTVDTVTRSQHPAPTSSQLEIFLIPDTGHSYLQLQPPRAEDGK